MEYKYEMIKTEDQLPVKIIIHTADIQMFIPRHWHESIEISYVLSGKIDQIYIDGKDYVSRQGDVVLINSNAIHSFSVNSGKNRKAVTIFIPNEFIQAVYPDIDQVAFDCVSIDDKERKAQFEELRCNLNSMVTTYENKENDPLAYIKVTSLSYELIYILLKNFKVDKKNSSSIKVRKYLERLNLITSFIKENYNQNLTLDLLSSTFYLSSEYLSRFFVKHTGMTVFDYINAIRLEKSYPELMNTDVPVIRIALNHGFPNEKSYNRVFKAVFHETPTQYRKNRNKR
ncbi:helix-turn-helix domain-containing protein [Candidatus Pristimantibacillus sp. PTI5]|uniref:helix-turn-helix domain-containing protein n=1 Tax=Candidatus Pristimantibacillus sp. PTI5 TaxID=3400422 RepID=UPI003B0254DC